MAIVINGSTGISATESSSVLGDGVVEAADLASGAAVSNIGYTPANIQAQNIHFRNRIINGDMRIDQRNAGAAVTANGSYAVDRFRLNQNVGSWSWQQDSSAPAGFVKSSKVTVTSSATPGSAAVAFYSQQIEGTNVADLGFGTANAKTVTCSFWVRSSVTGSYGIQFSNSASDRSYVDSYSISTADTWEYKTITVSGDTAGTWLNDTGVGLRVRWDLGGGSGTKTTAGSWVTGSFTGGATGTLSLVETNGATWYITGVQLEVGSVATEFERRPYGMELALCQRYFYKLGGSADSLIVSGYAGSAAGYYTYIPVKQSMRTKPTTTVVGSFTTLNVSSVAFDYGDTEGMAITISASGSGRYYWYADSSSDYVTFSAEL